MIVKKNSHLFILVFLLLIVTAGGCTTTSDSSSQIILAHHMSVNHPVSEGIGYMAKRIDEKSGGKLQINMYPSGQLAAERELLELLQVGTVDRGDVSAAMLGNFVPAYQVYELPYLMRSKKHMEKVLWGPVGKKLLLTGLDQHLRGIVYYDAGLRSFYSKEHPILKPEDLKGLKIRVQPSIMATNFIRTLGGSPTPIPYGELYTALQAGIVDGAENNVPSLYTSHHYEICKYYSITEHTGVPDVLMMSTEKWNKLSSQEQEWLQEAAEESAEYERKLWQESVQESMKTFEEAGVHIYHPDKEPFIESVQPMYKQFKEEHPKLEKWVNRIKQVN